MRNFVYRSLGWLAFTGAVALAVKGVAVSLDSASVVYGSGGPMLYVLGGSHFTPSALTPYGFAAASLVAVATALNRFIRYWVPGIVVSLIVAYLGCLAGLGYGPHAALVLQAPFLPMWALMPVPLALGWAVARIIDNRETGRDKDAAKYSGMLGEKVP